MNLRMSKFVLENKTKTLRKVYDRMKYRVQIIMMVWYRWRNIRMLFLCIWVFWDLWQTSERVHLLNTHHLERPHWPPTVHSQVLFEGFAWCPRGSVLLKWCPRVWPADGGLIPTGLLVKCFWKPSSHRLIREQLLFPAKPRPTSRSGASNTESVCSIRAQQSSSRMTAHLVFMTGGFSLRKAPFKTLTEMTFHTTITQNERFHAKMVQRL